jgi:hypothetical protein
MRVILHTWHSVGSSHTCIRAGRRSQGVAGSRSQARGGHNRKEPVRGERATIDSCESGQRSGSVRS